MEVSHSEWFTSLIRCYNDQSTSTPLFHTMPLYVLAVSPLWTAVSPNAPDTWAMTGPQCHTRSHTQSLVSAPRLPPHPAAPQRRRGSSCLQVSWLTHMSWQSPSISLHTRLSPSQDTFPRTGTHWTYAISITESDMGPACVCASHPSSANYCHLLLLSSATAVSLSIDIRVKNECYFKKCEV